MRSPAAPGVDRDLLVGLHARFPERYPALFESVARHPRIGRRSLLFGFPSDTPLVARGTGNGFFSALDSACAHATGFGHVVFLGYELLHDVEPSVRAPSTPPPLPAGFALPVACVMVLDHETGSVSFAGDTDAVQAMKADVASLEGAVPGVDVPVSLLSMEEDDPAAYLGAVRRAKEYIVAGDIFQANLSREWRAALGPDVRAVHVYRRLCAANPAPFAASVRFGDAAILSSSPERLLRREGPILESRPVAGTRPRVGHDGAMIAELIGSEKERAEHTMLVDLIRNDLGRVARYGSVTVDELMGVETYAHVHHIVSNVRCEMREGVGVGSALAAVFPGGTITGCPKVRCMEIIGELEGVGRGAYTGSLGYVTADGDFDFNILIRTMVFEPGWLCFRAGAGIVADSDPEFELAETRAKARGMLRALGA